MTANIIITVPTDEIAAVALWAREPDKERPWLEHVVFRGNEYMATDARRMVRVPCKTHGGDFGVHRRHILVAAAAQRELWRLRGDPQPTHRLLSFIPDNLTVAIVLSEHGAPDVTLRVSTGAIDHYPRESVEKLCSAGDCAGAPVPHGVNPAFLQGMADIHAANCRANPTERVVSERPVVLKSWNSDGRGVLLYVNDNNVRFLIMPMGLD